MDFEVLEWATLLRLAIAVITTIMSSVIIIIVTVILTTITTTYRLPVWSGTSITSVERRALLALTTLLVIEIITMTATTSTSTIIFEELKVVNIAVAPPLLTSAAHPLLPPLTLDPMVGEVVVVVVVVISSSSFEVAAPAERASTAVRRTCEVSVISREELVLAPLRVAAAEVATAAAGEA